MGKTDRPPRDNLQLSPTLLAENRSQAATRGLSLWSRRRQLSVGSAPPDQSRASSGFVSHFQRSSQVWGYDFLGRLLQADDEPRPLVFAGRRTALEAVDNHCGNPIETRFQLSISGMVRQARCIPKNFVKILERPMEASPVFFMPVRQGGEQRTGHREFGGAS
jgi:hypothetical protein